MVLRQLEEEHKLHSLKPQEMKSWNESKKNEKNEPLIMIKKDVTVAKEEDRGLWFLGCYGYLPLSLSLSLSPPSFPPPRPL